MGSKGLSIQCCTFGTPYKNVTYIVQPLNFVGSWIGFDGAVQVDIITLCYGHWVNVLAKGQLNFGRI